MASERFTGFADSRGAFFTKLEKNMNKAWFTEHRAEYDEGWHEPMRLLLEEVRDGLAKTYAPLELGDPKVMRIHRDVRFAKDKSPYKSWIGASLPLTAGKVPEQPTALYMHVGPKECFAGAGLYMMDAPRLEKLRAAILDDERGKEIGALAKKLEKKGYELLAAETLQRAPKGVDPDHPRIELLKMKGLVAMLPAIPRAELTSAKLAKRLIKGAKECAPLVTWLVRTTS